MSVDQQRIIAAAVDLADAEGLEPVTIRRVAQQLGAGTMSLYHYVPSKDAILDGMVDQVFAEIDLPPSDEPWRPALERRCVSMRGALRLHPWAIGLMDSRRNPGPATLQHHEQVLDCLANAGFSIQATAHTFALLDAYVYGFALQAASLPFAGPADLEEIADDLFSEEQAADLPRMAQFARDHALQPGYDFEQEFLPGLQVVLDGIEQAWAPRRG